MQRRQFSGMLAAGSALAAGGLLSACASSSGKGPQVVVIGGGYGGATAAKYVRMWSDYGIAVTLIEPNASFISCPMSNLVLGGSLAMADITSSYDNLTRVHGVRVLQDRAERIDAEKQVVVLASGAQLRYDRLILSPGVDFMWDALPAMKSPGAQAQVCLLYTSPSPRDRTRSRMPSSA